MAVIWRRKGGRNGTDPDQVLKDARAALNDLRLVLAEFRSNLDELEAEVRQPAQEDEEV